MGKIFPGSIGLLLCIPVLIFGVEKCRENSRGKMFCMIAGFLLMGFGATSLVITAFTDVAEARLHEEVVSKGKENTIPFKGDCTLCKTSPNRDP